MIIHQFYKKKGRQTSNQPIKQAKKKKAYLIHVLGNKRVVLNKKRKANKIKQTLTIFLIKKFTYFPPLDCGVGQQIRYDGTCP